MDTTRPSEPDPRRRRFLQRLSALWGSAAATVFALPIVGYLLGPALRPRPDQWVSLGNAEAFPRGETRLATFPNPLRRPWDGMTGNAAAYVRRLEGDEFLILSYNCTHLGCPVNWFPQSGLFMCPCHGGVYYENGDRASGPPPRGLYRYPEFKLENGQLWVKAGHLPTLQDTFDPPGSA